MANSMSLRSTSTSSGSSTSSLSSTFSDITSSSTSSSPPNSKTNAFFASPFSTRPPTPPAPTTTTTSTQPNRSLTAEFFGTPVTPPDPPASSVSSSSSKQKTPHLSRIFPSRYTSVSDRHSSDFYFDSIHDDPPDFVLPPHDRAPSTSSESSSPRLPTPPPLPQTPHREDTITLSNFSPSNPKPETTPKEQLYHHHLDDSYEEPTPRPASLQPGLLRFERELILQAQAKQKLEKQSPPNPPTHPEPSKLLHLDVDEGLQDEEPHPGSIISLPSPSLRSQSQTQTNSSSQSQAHLPRLLPVSPLSLTFTIASPSPTYSYSSSSSACPRPAVALDRETPTPTNANESGSLTRNSSLDELKPLPSPPPLAPSSSSSHVPRIPQAQQLLLSPTDSDNRNLEHDAQAHQLDQAPKLRLLRPLGHGAFSAVWLAEDLSRVPLRVVSKKSVRDLRRRASGRKDRERDRERDKERERERERQVDGGVDVEMNDQDKDQDQMTCKEDEVQVSEGAAGVEENASNKPKENPQPPQQQQQQRTPSTSRLREGLRNMWSFSRSSASSSNSNRCGSNNTVECSSSVGPASPPTMSVAPAVIEERKTDELEHEAVDGTGTTLSRNSSTRSSASTSTAASSSISRRSSMRSSKASSRNPSLRLKTQQQSQHLPHSHPPHRYPQAHSNYTHQHPLHQTQLHDGVTLSRDSSLRKFRERVRGTRPAFVLGRTYLDERDGVGILGGGGGNDGMNVDEFGVRMGQGMTVDDDSHSQPDHGPGTRTHTGGDESDAESIEGVGLGASLSRHSSLGTSYSYSSSRHKRQTSSGQGHGHGSSSSGSYFGRLVAVKMTPRRPFRVQAQGQGAVNGTRAREQEREEEERTRVGFVREVEVLKHISHPNITPLLAHLSTASRHILVLPYLPGGDLLGLVNNDVAWGLLGESVLRRIWCELCKAVGWMHGVGLVHRDIKLENVLLTTSAFTSLTPTSPRPTLSSLPPPPSPFIKLTDFGLSRFVEINANGDAELLSTRCGSEAYAAPELVTGGGDGGVYDARKTDAWACGVVLFALVGRQLPFGEGVEVGGGGGGKSRYRIGGERGKDEDVGLQRRRTSLADRRHWLMRIAKGEWEWPGQEDEDEEKKEKAHDQEEQQQQQKPVDELVGPQLVKSQGARRIVTRLLVRDPKKRARVVDLWDDAWMQGGGDEDEVLCRESNSNSSLRSPNVSLNGVDVDMDDLHRNPPPSWTFDGNSEDLRRDVDVGFYDDPSYPGRGYDQRPMEALGGGGEDGQVDGGMAVAMDGDNGGEEDDLDLDEELDEDDDLDDEDVDDEDVDEDEQDGCLFDHEPIDSITRQEVI